MLGDTLLPTEGTKFEVEERLKLFDQATQRQREREASRKESAPAADRGWTREDLYTRSLP